jgi:hypothetical protein
MNLVMILRGYDLELSGIVIAYIKVGLKKRKEIKMKTKWFKFWYSGKVGYGANETFYQSDDPNNSFSGYRRLDWPAWRGNVWKFMQVGETLETISNTIVERIA